MKIKKRVLSVLGAACMLGMLSCAEAASETNLMYRFEDYTGGSVKVTTPAVSAPWISSVEFAGKTAYLEAAETAKGKSLWFKTGENDYSYIAAAVSTEPVTDTTVFEFDVMPLGVGTKPIVASVWGSKDTANTQNQPTWSVYPDGTLGIYARGYEGCYTRGATAIPKDASGNPIKIPVGEWSKLAVVFNQNTLKLSYYVNGECIKSNCAFYSFGTGTDNLWKADDKPTGFTYYRMQMDKDANYASLSEDEKASFGAYIDNLRIYKSDVAELIEESTYFGTACDFEDYEGGKVEFTSYDALAPFKTDISMNANHGQYTAVDTEKGKSLWIFKDNSNNNDGYIDGAFFDKASTDKIIMQFDVKPLGYGSASTFGMKGKKADGTDCFQRLYTVSPDGSLKIYARGAIINLDGTKEECYTEGAAVTLKKGSGQKYTSADAVTIPVGEWSRLAAVYDVAGKKISYYVNGELIFDKAVPFNNGNNLNTTGITNIRIQTPKFKEYDSLSAEEQKNVGMYVDNLKVSCSSSPIELSGGRYDIKMYRESGEEVADSENLADGRYEIKLTACGDDTSNLDRSGRLYAAVYSRNRLVDVVVSDTRINKNRDKTACVAVDYSAGEKICIYYWDKSQKPIINVKEYGEKDLPVQILSVTSEEVGNIFTDEYCNVNVNIKNLSDSDGTARIYYELDDSRGNPASSGTSAVEIEKTAETSIACSVRLPKYGTYNLKVSAEGESGVFSTEEYNISRVIKNTQTDNTLGVNTHFNQKKGDIEKNLNLIKNAGIGFIRDEISWDRAEKEKGVISFEGDVWDDYVNAACEKGIDVLMVLGSTNKFYSGGKFPIGEEAVQAFANYAGETAKHFAGRVKYYEIFNEAYTNKYYSSQNTGERYAELVKAAAAQIRKADPSAKIIANLECFTDDKHHYNYTLAALNSGICEAIDIVALHPYVQPAAPDNEDGIFKRCETFFDDIRQYNKDLWISEVGWSTCERYVTQAEAASSIVKTKIVNQAENHFDKIFIYDFQNDGNNVNESEHMYGLIECWRENSSPFAAKPAYVALSAAEYILKDFVHEDTEYDGKIKQYHFKKDGEKLSAVWSVKGNEVLHLSDMPDTILCYDIFGNEKELKSADGEYNIELNSDVLYLKY